MSSGDEYHAQLLRESAEARAGVDCPNPYCLARKGEACRNPGEAEPSENTVHVSRRIAHECTQARMGIACPNPYCLARQGEPCLKTGEILRFASHLDGIAVHFARRAAYDQKVRT